MMTEENMILHRQVYASEPDYVWHKRQREQATDPALIAWLDRVIASDDATLARWTETLRMAGCSDDAEVRNEVLTLAQAPSLADIESLNASLADATAAFEQGLIPESDWQQTRDGILAQIADKQVWIDFIEELKGGAPTWPL